MKQKNKQGSPAERYEEVSIGYCKEMGDYLGSIEKELSEVRENMNMNDSYHADALRSFTWGFIDKVEKDIEKIGRRYQNSVRNIRDIVVNE